MAKITICCDGKYPYGDAGSNRVQHIIKALILEQHQVSLISKASEYGKVADAAYSHHTVCSPKNRLLRFISEKIIIGCLVVKELCKNNKQNADYIYVYGSNALFVLPIILFGRIKKIKSIIDVVEDHQPFQYTLKYADPRWISNAITYNILAPLFNKAVCISKHIKRHFDKYNIETVIIPPIIDIPKEFSCHSQREHREIIYCGNPIKKDDMFTMLRSFYSICEDFNVTFNITGISKNKLLKHYGENIFNQLGEKVKVHGWLSRGELENLYNNMDFLLLSRPDNIVTQANFPSKLPELLARGIVPICNKVGDFPEYLTHGIDSILFENNSVHDCSEALTKSLNMDYSEVLKMKKAARATAVKNFSILNAPTII